MEGKWKMEKIEKKRKHWKESKENKIAMDGEVEDGEK